MLKIKTIFAWSAGSSDHMTMLALTDIIKGHRNTKSNLISPLHITNFDWLILMLLFGCLWQCIGRTTKVTLSSETQ